jgi:predicted nucleic-acid-binding protein
VPIEALCEVVYVLNGHYQTDRITISAELRNFFGKTACIISHRAAILKGLEYFGQTTLDFVDCILAGYAEIERDEIHTFDDKLQKLISKILNH